jgi:flavin-dependent dehydrogenase
MLNRKRAVPLKPTPPPFRNHGNVVVSLAELNRWLAEKAEEAGAYILSETTGTSCSSEDGVVRGVRTGDKGRDKAAARSPTSSRARTSWRGRPCSPRAAGGISPARR